MIFLTRDQGFTSTAEATCRVGNDISRQRAPRSSMILSKAAISLIFNPDGLFENNVVPHFSCPTYRCDIALFTKLEPIPNLNTCRLDSQDNTRLTL